MKIDIFPPLSIHELGQRDNQEDALYPQTGTTSDRLFVLCDGMGRYEGGEKASQLVCQSLGKWFDEHTISECPFTDFLLREAIEYAYTELDKLDEDGLSHMGTTLTLLYIHRHGITAAYIGDSRIYIFAKVPQLQRMVEKVLFFINPATTHLFTTYINRGR